MNKFAFIFFFFLFLFLLTSVSFAEKMVVVSEKPTNKLNHQTLSQAEFYKKVRYNPAYLKENMQVSKNHSIISVSDAEYKALEKRKDISVRVLDFNPENIELFQTISMPSVFANYAWDLGVTGAGTQVGIIDTGIDENSLPFIGKITAAQSFCAAPNDDVNCEHWHGCAVASIAAGSASDLNGVAKDANIIMARVFDGDQISPSWCATSSYYTIFSYVVNAGARIINNSWGNSVLEPDGNNNAETWDTFDINFLDSNKETMLVFAAGNDGPGTSTISNDCSAYNVICVGGMYDNDTNNRSDDIVYSASSWGPTTDLRKKPDIVAPGQSILSYLDSNDQGTWSGTSASSPHVTGALALLEEVGVTGLNAKAVLLNSADDVNSDSWDKYTGWGYLNIQNAIDWNGFVSQDFISDSILTPIDNNLQTTYINPTYANFYSANSDTNLKCTAVWRRIFDANDDSFVQNFDLFANVDATTDTSDSEIDNVEQVFVNDSGSAKIKVYLGDGGVDSSDINYALACNVDFNDLNDPIDYYVSLDDSNYYTSAEDGNFSLLFNFDKNTLAEEDINFDVEFAYELNNGAVILSATDSFTDKNNGSTLSLDFNYNFASLKDYNLIVDYNILSSDYNHTIIGQDSVWFSTANLDLNSPVLDTNLEDAYYLIDENIDENLIFTDTHIFSLALTNNEGTDYTFDITDSNTITYNLDFNIANYDAFAKYDFNFLTRDVFGNTVAQNTEVYYKPVFSEDLNIDFDTNILSVESDAVDANIIFEFSPDYNYELYAVTYDEYDSFAGCDENYWYLCYDSNAELLDVNVFDFTNNSGTTYYNLELDNNYLIAIKWTDQNEFLVDLNIVFESAAEPDTPDPPGGGGGGGTSGYEFSVLSSESDGKFYVGKEITITLKEDDSISIVANVDVNITYPDGTIVTKKTDSSGLLKFVPNEDGNYSLKYKTNKDKTTMTVLSASLMPKEIVEETVVQEKGNVEIKTFSKFFVVYLYDENNLLITSGIAKLIVDGKESSVAINTGTISLDDSLAGKEIELSVANKNGKIIFNKTFFLSSFVQKPIDTNFDYNNIQIMNTDLNADLENSSFNLETVFWIAGIVLGILLVAFLVWRFTYI